MTGGGFANPYGLEDLDRGKDAPLSRRGRILWWITIAVLVVGGVVLITLER